MSIRVVAVALAIAVFLGLRTLPALPDVAADRSIFVVPFVLEASFDDEALAARVTRRVMSALAEAQHRVADAPAEGPAVEAPEDLARRLSVRFVFSGSLGRDIDNVTLKWRLYDALAAATAAQGVMQADWDNMDVAMHLEIAAQLTPAMNKPASEEALCRAGNRRLEAAIKPGGGADGLPVEARLRVRAAADKAFEQLGDRMFDVCLPYLDQAFEALGLVHGYVKAAAR
jgi:TolB-like protein